MLAIGGMSDDQLRAQFMHVNQIKTLVIRKSLWCTHVLSVAISIIVPDSFLIDWCVSVVCWDKEIVPLVHGLLGLLAAWLWDTINNLNTIPIMTLSSHDHILLCSVSAKILLCTTPAQLADRMPLWFHLQMSYLSARWLSSSPRQIIEFPLKANIPVVCLYCHNSYIWVNCLRDKMLRSFDLFCVQLM